RVPMAEMQDEIAALGSHALGDGRIALRCLAERLAPCLATSYSECVVSRMTDFVARDAHHPVRITAFDFPHHRTLEPQQARVREIKGNRDPGNSVRREPFDGQPDVGTQPKVTAVELAIDIANRTLNRFVSQRQLEIA